MAKFLFFIPKAFHERASDVQMISSSPLLEKIMMIVEAIEIGGL
jgi:hypothetical protein